MWKKLPYSHHRWVRTEEGADKIAADVAKHHNKGRDASIGVASGISGGRIVIEGRREGQDPIT